MNKKTLYLATQELKKALSEAFKDYRANKDMVSTKEKLTTISNTLIKLIEEVK